MRMAQTGGWIHAIEPAGSSESCRRPSRQADRAGRHPRLPVIGYRRPLDGWGSPSSRWSRQSYRRGGRELVLLVAGATTTPGAPRAQQKAMPVIGYLSSTSPIPAAPVLAAFRQGLSETGYVEGQNVGIEFRWAEGRYDRLPALAAELVDRKV